MNRPRQHKCWFPSESVYRNRSFPEWKYLFEIETRVRSEVQAQNESRCSLFSRANLFGPERNLIIRNVPVTTSNRILSEWLLPMRHWYSCGCLLPRKPSSHLDCMTVYSKRRASVGRESNDFGIGQVLWLGPLFTVSKVARCTILGNTSYIDNVYLMNV